MNNDEIKNMSEALEDDVWVNDMERRWHASLPQLKEREWLEVFPETRETLPAKLAEWRSEIFRLKMIAKRALRGCPDDEYLKIRMYLQVRIVPLIQAAEKHIGRLRWLTPSGSSKPTHGRITDLAIQQAKAVPIESLIQTKTRRSGKTLITNCPLHEDKRPSFVIYTESNTCWCFGCQEGGDSIALIQKLHGYLFAEAVQHLTNVL